MSAETTIKCDGCQRTARPKDNFGNLMFFGGDYLRIHEALKHTDWHYCSERCLVLTLEEVVKRVGILPLSTSKPIEEPPVPSRVLTSTWVKNCACFESYCEHRHNWEADQVFGVKSSYRPAEPGKAHGERKT